MSALKQILVKGHEKWSNENENTKLQSDTSRYDKTYDVAKSTFRKVAVRLMTDDPHWKRVLFDGLYWLQFVHQVLAVTLEMVNIMQTAQGGSFEDAVQIFRMMPCVGYLLLAMSKSCKAVYHRSVFESLIAELRTLWPEEERLGAEERKIVERSLRRVHLVIGGYYWCNMALLMIFMLPSFVNVAEQMTGHAAAMLPFFYWLPFDPYQRVYYEVVFVTQCWIAVSVIFFIISGDLFFFVFLNHITMQFDLLAVRVRRLVYVPIDRHLVDGYDLAEYSKQYLESTKEDIDVTDFKQWERRHLKELTKIILIHRDLIRLSGDVEEMYSFALLVNFFNSSIIICFCGFCIAVVEKWNELVYKIFIVTCLSQTWLLCWYGQRLIESSEGVSEALYNSGWYQASKKVKSSIIIMIYRAQKEVHVTTYGFSAISLRSYTTIMKTSWSYFTLLLKIYKK